MPMTYLGFANKSHWLYFLGDFRRRPFPEIIGDNILQIWHPLFLNRSLNAKNNLRWFTESLNNSFMDYWHLHIKVNMYY